MKSKIILGIIIIISTFATAMAAPISHTKIKQLIKKAAEDPNAQHKTLAGMDTGIRQGGSSCRDAIVKKINIHKVGKTSTGSYRVINSYEDSRKVFASQDFDVTFSLQGSCKLTFPAYVGSRDIRKNGKRYKKIFKGRVPLRSTLLTTSISRDSFYKNKWSTSPLRFVNNNETKEERESYRIKLYKKIGKNQLCRDLEHSSTMSYNVNVIRCKVVSQGSMKNDSRSHADTQRMQSIEKELSLYAKSYPNAVKLISSQKQVVIKDAFRKIMRAETPQERRRLFIQTLDNWERTSGKTPPHRSFKKGPTRSNNKHSHGGRDHTHALPAQGKSHRHRNGSLGR